MRLPVTEVNQDFATASIIALLYLRGTLPRFPAALSSGAGGASIIAGRSALAELSVFLRLILAHFLVLIILGASSCPSCASLLNRSRSRSPGAKPSAAIHLVYVISLCSLLTPLTLCCAVSFDAAEAVLGFPF